MTNELFDFLNVQIKTILPNFYRNRALTTAPFPYGVCKFDVLSDTYPTYDYSVVMALYEKVGVSIRELENKADSIIKLLNNNVFESDGYRYHFTLSMRQMIDEQHLEGSQVIELQFLVRMYGKE